MLDVNKLSKYEGGLIGAIFGASTGVSVATGNLIWVIAAVAICLPIHHMLRRRVDEVIEDEMIFRISEKASRTAFRIFTPVAAFAGLVIVVLRGTYPQYLQLGLTLTYSACSLMIIYVAAVRYYMKKGV